jgi:hypothetical protein
MERDWMFVEMREVPALTSAPPPPPRYNTTLPPTRAPVTASPTTPPTSFPTTGPVYNCTRIVARLDLLCGATLPATDTRDDTVCTFDVSGGVGTIEVPMTSEVASCTCDMWGLNLSVLSGGAYTYTCTGAAYSPRSTTSAVDLQPLKPTCWLLDNDDPWARCLPPLLDWSECDSSFQCAVGLACRVSGTGGRCLKYSDCTWAEGDDNTTSPNKCAPIDQANNNITSAWCEAGDFWTASNYTVLDTKTEAWDGTAAAVEVIAALEAIFANATAVSATTCVCTDVRKVGWTPFLVMVEHTVSPTPAFVTSPPTASYTASPSSPSPTTRAPTTSTPTSAPTTHAPTTPSPTPEPLNYPLVPEQCTESEPLAEFALCTFPSSTILGAIACSSASFSGCDQNGVACSGTFGHVAGLQDHMCGTSSSAPYTSPPSLLPSVVPMTYYQCTNVEYGVSGVCINGNQFTGYPVVYYCHAGTATAQIICANSYPCTGPDEYFYGNAGINRSIHACYTSTEAPISSPQPTTAAPVTTLSPTSAPTTGTPTSAPTEYYPYVSNPNETVRNFWPAGTTNIMYVWQYRLRGPYIIVNAAGELVLTDPDKDILWPSNERCSAEPSCSVLGTVDFIDPPPPLSACTWLCVSFQYTDQSTAPLMVQAGVALNMSECSLPRHLLMNTVVLTSFVMSTQFRDLVDVVATVKPSSSLMSVFLWAPWMNMTADWMSTNGLDPASCSGDVGVSATTGCRGRLVYFPNYTSWRSTRTSLTQYYLDNTTFAELKQEVPRLFPDLNVTWGQPGQPESITYNDTASANVMRVWSILKSYQEATLTAAASSVCWATNTQVALGMYGHTGGDPFGEPQLVVATENYTTDGYCIASRPCGSYAVGHPACFDVPTAAECASVPLCMVCNEDTTQAPSPFVTDSLPPTPARPSPVDGSLDIRPAIGFVGGLVAVVAVLVVVMALIAFYHLRHTDTADEERELLEDDGL